MSLHEQNGENDSSHCAVHAPRWLRQIMARVRKMSSGRRAPADPEMPNASKQGCRTRVERTESAAALVNGRIFAIDSRDGSLQSKALEP